VALVSAPQHNASGNIRRRAAWRELPRASSPRTYKHRGNPSTASHIFHLCCGTSNAAGAWRTSSPAPPRRDVRRRGSDADRYGAWRAFAAVLGMGIV
jgi:hypothetical protein